MLAGLKKIEICLVEDEADLREELAGALLDVGFGVRAFSASRELYAALLMAPCNIVILDIGLPGEDGFSIAARLHNLGSMGIIMLSARVAIEDRVRSLQGGADVYLTKPVDLRELVAVVSSLARRLAAPAPAQAVRPPDISTSTSTTPTWSLSADSWAVLAPDNTSLPLTAQERAFLMRLWACAGQAVSREELAIALGGDPYEYDFHRLDALVSRLRRKVIDLGFSLPLRAVRGTGYVITPASESTAD